MSDRLIDAKSGDYVAAAAGRWASCDALQNQITLSYTIELGSFEGDPTFGHRFLELQRAVNSPETRARAADLVRAAVQWLIDLGLLARVDVVVESIDENTLAFEADHYPPGGDAAAIEAGPHFISVGGN